MSRRTPILISSSDESDFSEIVLDSDREDFVDLTGDSDTGDSEPLPPYVADPDRQPGGKLNPIVIE